MRVKEVHGRLKKIESDQEKTIEALKHHENKHFSYGDAVVETLDNCNSVDEFFDYQECPLHENNVTRLLVSEYYKLEEEKQELFDMEVL